MNERRHERTTRRLPVRFARRGHPDDPVRRGYTTNVSAGGMYVATTNPFPSGTVLRCHVGDEANDVVLDGVVAHSHKIARELGTAVGTAGMGVRLYSVRELLEQVNPTAAAPAEPAEPPSGDAWSSPPEPPPLPPPQPPAPEAREARGAPESVDAPQATTASPSSSGPTLALPFASAEELAEVYHRDAAHGGLFVPTDEAHGLGETVTVEVRVPGVAPVRLGARVVHRLGPGELPGGPVGVGVQFLDLAAAREALGRLVSG